MEKLKLFCLPHAGGSANIYRKWEAHLNDGISLVPLELPGRGTRFVDEMPDDFNELVEDLLETMKDKGLNGPFALLGHSFGSLLIFELYHRLVEEGGPLPVHLIFSGRNAPHYKGSGPDLNALPEEELIEGIMAFGGTDADVFKNPELRELVVPIIRQDLFLAETYHYNEKPGIDHPFTVIYSHDDPVISDERINAWKEHSGSGGCEIVSFKGGHMYLHNHVQTVCQAINGVLVNYL